MPAVKAIVVLADRTRHEIEIDAAILARGKLEFDLNDSDVDRVLRKAPMLDPMATVRHCYRAGSDDGVPVFVER